MKRGIEKGSIGRAILEMNGDAEGEKKCVARRVKALTFSAISNIIRRRGE